MNENCFTPGPWFRKGQRVYWKKPDKDLPRGTLPNGLICTCKSAEDWPECDEEARANAALIAAAPDLLHALEHTAHTLCVTQCAPCLPQGSETGMAIFFREGCPRGCSSFDCDIAKWWEIIRKVVGII